MAKAKKATKKPVKKIKKVVKAKSTKSAPAKKAVKKVVKKAVKKVVKKATKKVVKKAVKAKSKPKTAKKTKKILAVPKGYNSITPYLIVNQALNAIEFYKKAFGAKEVMCMQDETGCVNHAELQIGDAKIMLADECPEMNARAPQSYGGSPVSIHLYIPNVDAVVERALAAGAVLARPVQDMYYGDRSGAVMDPFGHVWFISTHVEDVTPAQMKKRVAAMCEHKDHACEEHA